jgi:hypothetical protein
MIQQNERHDGENNSDHLNGVHTLVINPEADASVAKMDRSNQAVPVLESRLVCTIAGNHAKVPNRDVEQTQRSILKFGEAANFLDKYSPTPKKAAERSNQQNSGKRFTNSIKSHPRSGFIFPRPSIPRADAALIRTSGPTPANGH